MRNQRALSEIACSVLWKEVTDYRVHRRGDDYQQSPWRYLSSLISQPTSSHKGIAFLSLHFIDLIKLTGKRGKMKIILMHVIKRSLLSVRINVTRGNCIYSE